MNSSQLTQLSAVQVIGSIQHQLGLDVSEVARSLTMEILIAEYMRCWLTPSTRQVGNERILPRSLLLSYVRSQLGQLQEFTGASQFINSDAGPDLIERVFKRLRYVREITELPGRLVQLSALRVIDLPTDEQLVLGGCDGISLSQSLGVRSEFCAFVRSLKCADDESGPPVYVGSRQDLHSWAGIPRIALTDWATLILKRAERELLPGGGGEEATKVYMPHKSDNALHRRRWLTLSSQTRPQPRLHLVRRDMPRTQYFLASLRPSSSGVIINKECKLPTATARRLQFAFDIGYDTRMTGTIECSGDSCRVRLPAWLPAEEERVIQALCILEHSTTQQRERSLIFDRRWIPTIEVLLSGLGVTLSAA